MDLMQLKASTNEITPKEEEKNDDEPMPCVLPTTGKDH